MQRIQDPESSMVVPEHPEPHSLENIETGFGIQVLSTFSQAEQNHRAGIRSRHQPHQIEKLYRFKEPVCSPGIPGHIQKGTGGSPLLDGKENERKGY